MMREARQQVEELFYGNVMFARGRAGRALTILHAQMRADGLQPNSFCYNAAVGTASRSKRWRQAIAPKEEMEAEIIRNNDPGIAPTVHTYDGVFHILPYDENGNAGPC